MAILETSFVVDFLRKKSEALELLNKLEEMEPNLYVAVPTIMEVWEGAIKNTKASGEEKGRVDEFINALIVLPLETNGAKRAAEIVMDAVQRGDKIETEDAMIAGIAMTNGETLVTNDSDYTRIPGLTVLKY
ncbi:MAG TPA: PIN domain-containing protein [Candidatus Nanoarchaeia archaeon]|nr:PIN domain-containing protein [Candidatus Nanoarchaeia archaeon]